MINFFSNIKKVKGGIYFDLKYYCFYFLILSGFYNNSYAIIDPYPKNEKKCSAVLKKNHGIKMPNVCRAVGSSQKKAIWFGNFTLFIGEEPNIALDEVAAVVDQSDAWCSLRLTGTYAEDVMQRLCPIDVRLRLFKTGYVAKTMLGLMQVTLHRSGKEQFDIYGYRSMSRTLINEITGSMKKTMRVVKQK